MQAILSSYSLSHWLNETGGSALDALRMAAELGFDGMEFTELTPSDGESPESLADRIREEAARLGLCIANYVVGADFGGEEAAAQVQRVCHQVELAARLGSPRMRHDVLYALPPEQTFDDVLPRLAACCRQVAAYGAEQGVTTLVENHGFICQDSTRMVALYRQVNHPQFGLLADMGNFLCADEESLSACRRVAPLARYVHAKDFLFKAADAPDPGDGWLTTRGGNHIRGTVLGHGVVPVRDCLAALRAAGYDGPVTLEFEGLERNLDALRLGLAFLRRAWEEAAPEQ